MKGVHTQGWFTQARSEIMLTTVTNNIDLENNKNECEMSM